MVPRVSCGRCATAAVFGKIEQCTKFIAPGLARKQPKHAHTTHTSLGLFVPCASPPRRSFFLPASRQPSGKTVVTVSDLVRAFPLGPSYHFDILRPDGLFESVQVSRLHRTRPWKHSSMDRTTCSKRIAVVRWAGLLLSPPNAP